ncbi:MAG: delta-60 repeat domain-containing protein, partial [Verrucomicrobia bacterium]|nr:delta-60 repeat domain-containing protein [Verrucomicrobiota bacterium]
GGEFTGFGTIPRMHLARLTTTGSLDDFDARIEGSPPGNTDAVTSFVKALAVQADGKILVGGKFALVNGLGRNGLARLDAQGNLDNSFDPGLEPGNSIQAIAVQGDGKLIIIGSFTRIGGISRSSIARLNSDGTLDASFQLQISAEIRAFMAGASSSEGKLIVGGQFGDFTFNGFKVLARLNSDGSVDSSFPMVTGRQPGAGFASDRVHSIALQKNGRIVVGGWIHSINGTPSSGVARLAADGALDETVNLDSEITGGSSGDRGPRPSSVDLTEVRCVVVQPDDKILIAGDFTKVNGVQRNYVARLVGEPVSTNSLSLGLTLSNGGAILSWPASAADFVLEEASSLMPGTSWTRVTASPILVRDQFVATVTVVGAVKFYRLRKL